MQPEMSVVRVVMSVRQVATAPDMGRRPPAATGSRLSSRRPIRRSRRPVLTLHAPQEPSHNSSRWSVVQYALGSWTRTTQLCLILLVMTGGIITILVELIQHI